jgi:hypothetical protein
MTGELRKILSEKAKELTRKIDVIIMKETNLPRVSFDYKILGNLLHGSCSRKLSNLTRLRATSNWRIYKALGGDRSIEQESFRARFQS